MPTTWSKRRERSSQRREQTQKKTGGQKTRLDRYAEERWTGDKARQLGVEVQKTRLDRWAEERWTEDKAGQIITSL